MENKQPTERERMRERIDTLLRLYAGEVEQLLEESEEFCTSTLLTLRDKYIAKFIAIPGLEDKEAK